MNIEKQIYFYWNFIKENVDKEVQTSDDRRTTIIKGSLVHKNSSILKNHQQNYAATGYFSSHEHFQIKVAKIHGIPDDDTQPEPSD